MASTVILPPQPKLLINNQWVDAKSGKTFETRNPATNELLANVAEGDAADVDLAVEAAQAAFATWRLVDPTVRAAVLFKFADLLEKNARKMAELETADNGKPIAETTGVDVPLTINTFRYFGGLADKNHGKTIPVDGTSFCMTVHEPVGVVGQIIPWNFPLLMFAWKVAPALACGCTVVLKPAEQTPLSALYAGALLIEAGMPPGVVNIVTGFGPTAGAAVARHPKIDKVAFTGSTEVGRIIMKLAAESNIKRVTLELGGKSPLVVMPDYDIDKALNTCKVGVFFNQGQVCCASSRVFVHEKIYDKFLERAKVVYGARKVGDPMKEDTEQGSQIDAAQFATISKYIEAGKKEGATLVCGGSRVGTTGYFVQPTVFADVKDNMTIAKEEIFGPVMSVLRFSTLDDVILRCNSSNYGLAAGILTNDLSTAMLFARHVRAGTVWVNTYNEFHVQVPFGGYRESGFGREMSKYSLRNYTEVKAVMISVPPHTAPVF